MIWLPLKENLMELDEIKDRLEVLGFKCEKLEKVGFRAWFYPVSKVQRGDLSIVGGVGIWWVRNTNVLILSTVLKFPTWWWLGRLGMEVKKSETDEKKLGKMGQGLRREAKRELTWMLQFWERGTELTQVLELMLVGWKYFTRVEDFGAWIKKIAAESAGWVGMRGLEVIDRVGEIYAKVARPEYSIEALSVHRGRWAKVFEEVWPVGLTLKGVYHGKRTSASRKRSGDETGESE